MPATVPEPDTVRVVSTSAPAWRFWRAAWRAGWVLAGVVGTVLALAWGVLLWQILPRAHEWRDDLAKQATQALGVPVVLESVEGRRQGLWPVLVLRQVRLLDAQGQPALTLPEVQARVSLATLSPWAWLDGQLRLGELRLVGPDLDVRRDVQGRLWVAGLPLGGDQPSATPSDGPTAADWVLTQAGIRIERGRVQWRDEWLGAPTLALTDVDLVLRNRLGLAGRLHDLNVQATPPQEVGQRFSLQARLGHPWRSRPSDWRDWSGTVQAQWPQVDVRRWRDHVRLPLELMAGTGRLAAELQLEDGRLRELTLDTDVRGVRMRWQRGLPDMVLRQLQGQWILTQEDERTTLGWKGLSFELGDGQRWPASSAQLEWRHAALKAGQVWVGPEQALSGRVRASLLDLQMLATLGDRLPLPRHWRDTLRMHSPAGVLQDLNAQWSGPLAKPASYSVQARARGLQWMPSLPGAGQQPGLAGAQIDLKANERGGEATLAIQQGWLAFPGVFEEPRIEVDRLQASVRWQHQQDHWVLQVKQASFANADAQGQLDAEWRSSRPGERDAQGQALQPLPGWLRLTGRLEQAQATRVWRYLPLTIPPDTRAYVRDAFQAGVGEGVTFEVDGELNAFPFKDDVGGRFRVEVPLRDVSMSYVPPALLGLPADATRGVWAPLTDLKGLLRFEGQRMLISQATGRLATVGSGQFQLRDVQGRIDNLGDDDPRLLVSGQGKGPLGDALQFLARSPISAWTGHALDDAQARGQGALTLSLDIPLMRSDDTQVSGALSMADADAAALRLTPQVPWLTAVQGKVAFTERALDVQAQGRVWGELMTVQGQRGADGVARFKAQGRMGARGLAQAHDYPALARLAPWLEGESPVQVLVEVGEARLRQGLPLVDVTVQSSLQGLQSRLPAPLTKPASSAWPLRVNVAMPQADSPHDLLRIDLGGPQASATGPQTWLHADLHLLRQTAAGTSAVRGGVHVIQADQRVATRPTGRPERGLHAQVQVNHLDLDAWSAVAKAMATPPTMAGLTLPGPRAAVATDHTTSDWTPEMLNLRADTVSWRQRTLHDVNVSLAHPAARVWRAQLEAREVAGVLEWLPDVSAAGASPGAQKLVARLKRLTVPRADAESISAQAVQGLLQPETTTTSVPALDVVVDDFEWRGLSLGKFEVQAINRRVADGDGRSWPEWRLTRFRLGGPEAQLQAQGNWTASAAAPIVGLPARSRSAFSFTLDVGNGGDLLNRLGWPKTVRGAKGQLSGHVAWWGSPLDLDADTLSGDIKVRFNQGQFLKVDPGAAKLLGVLSLQALPRRLALDFRDIFQEGFAFDAIDGDLQIKQGVATTRNLRMRGVQAVVLMEGQANLKTETQDLQVYVVPDVNAGAASLAYAAINPVVGLGTFVAQMLLRKQVAEAGTQAFHITGPWNDPQVNRVLSARELSASHDGAQSPPAPTALPASP